MSSLKHYVLKNRSGWRSGENNEMALKNKKTIRTKRKHGVEGRGRGGKRAGIEGCVKKEGELWVKEWGGEDRNKKM